MLRTEPKDPFADVPGARNGSIWKFRIYENILISSVLIVSEPPEREMTLTVDGAKIGSRLSSLSMRPNSKYQNYSSKDRIENERERVCTKTKLL